MGTIDGPVTMLKSNATHPIYQSPKVLNADRSFPLSETEVRYAVKVGRKLDAEVIIYHAIK